MVAIPYISFFLYHVFINCCWKDAIIRENSVKVEVQLPIPTYTVKLVQCHTEPSSFNLFGNIIQTFLKKNIPFTHVTMVTALILINVIKLANYVL